MQIPAAYGIILLIANLLHYAILIGGVSFIFEKRTRVLGIYVVAADLLLLSGQSMAAGYFFFHYLPSHFWIVLSLGLIAVITALQLGAKLGGKRLFDHNFKRRYAKIFALAFWIFFMNGLLRSILEIH